jgi:hypothetical protein
VLDLSINYHVQFMRPLRSSGQRFARALDDGPEKGALITEHLSDRVDKPPPPRMCGADPFPRSSKGAGSTALGHLEAGSASAVRAIEQSLQGR